MSFLRIDKKQEKNLIKMSITARISLPKQETDRLKA
jgi:hypothetical protein